MKIPDGRSGLPTVSATQLRAYGAGGFRLPDQELTRGCPRAYHARYVLGEANERTERMRYGTLFHRVLELAERDGADPYEVLPRVFPADLDPDRMAEARGDLGLYLARPPSRLDTMQTVDVELDAEALLYEDEQFGPVMYRAILDKLLVDPAAPDELHIVDYKTSQSPPSRADLRGDVQLRGQAWLMRRRWAAQFPGSDPVVWTHLDAIKWRDLDVRYTAGELDDWRMWAEAVCRTILRDTDAAPEVNAGCPTCVVRADCPAYLALPSRAGSLAAAMAAGDLEERVSWRDEANAARLLLEKAVAAFDQELAAVVESGGPVAAGKWVWSQADTYGKRLDVERLRELMGPEFWGVVTVPRSRVEEVTADWPQELRDAIDDCWEEHLTGQRVKRTKLRPNHPPD